MLGRVGYIGTIDDYTPGIHRYRAADYVEKRGLAAPVGADHRHEGTFCDRQRKVREKAHLCNVAGVVYLSYFIKTYHFAHAARSFLRSLKTSATVNSIAIRSLLYADGMPIFVAATRHA